MKTTPEAALEKITAWLVQLYGERLQSLVVYGSLAPGGNHDAQRSDINLLAVLDRLDAATLDQGAPAVQWWSAQGNPPLVMLARDEQNDAAEVFPIEYLDIQAHHRVLKGEDLFAQAPHYPEIHRRHVEHDLRAKLLRLRGAYMSVGHDAKKLEALLLDSSSAFLTLFRHALVAVGEPMRVPKDEVLAAAAARFHFAPASFAAILAARRGNARLEGGKLEALRHLFAHYLAAIHQVESGLEDNGGSENRHES